MKLRNKRSGEIGRIAKTKTDDDEIEIITDTKVYLYKSISEVCQHWEDYEEPKEYWFIDFNGEIKEFEVLGFEWQGWMEEIGNHFVTKEEAEQAVEKLKAWKRLKDKGFRPKMWEWEYIYDDNISGELIIKAHIDDATDSDGKYTKDLDLLFSQEDD